MFRLIALVKPFRARAVLTALDSIPNHGGTVQEVMGHGRQKNRLHHYLGSEYNASFIPKVEITVFLEEDQVPAAIKAIVGQARTGRMGDGKILILPCLSPIVAWSSGRTENAIAPPPIGLKSLEPPSPLLPDPESPG